MSQPVAYLNGQLVPRSSLAVPIADLGFLLGTTVAEQMRTFGGKLFHPLEHFQRLARSLETVGIDPELSQAHFGQLAEELVARNHPLLEEGDDLGLTVFVTPGFPQENPPRPTVCLHTQPVDFPVV